MDDGRAPAQRVSLAAGEARLALIVDSVTDAILSVDDEQRVVLFNRGAERIFGISASEALGQKLDRFLPERFREAHRGHVERFGTTGVTPRRMGALSTLSALRADGTEFPIEATISQAVEQGRKFFTVVLRDVTERVRLEARLRLLARAGAVLASSLDAEETLARKAEVVVDTIADVCVIYLVEDDGALRPVAVAGAAQKPIRELLERYPPRPDDVRGVAQVVRTGRSELYAEVTGEALAASARDPEHLSLLREAGIASSMVVPLRARDRTFGAMSVISTDPRRRYGPDDLVTAEELARRAAMAVENARLYGQLQEADRRKDQFLAMLAHELRNPLSAISNALQVMRHAPPGDDRSLRAADIIERQVVHQVRLVDDLLDVTRIARDRMELDLQPLDLAALVRDTAEDHRGGLEKAGLRLELDLPAGPVFVLADGTRLAQVLGNLLHNAQKFTEPGGTIGVRMEENPAAGQVAVHVSDTGVGVEAGLLPHVFDLFTQAAQSLERARGGLGLGLALVRGLVGLHGGTVAATSLPGEGSTFSFCLPTAGEVFPEAPPSPARARQERRRVLVVEDNPGAAESLHDLLQVLGHEPAVAGNGHQGLEMARRLRPEVVLCDLGLPGLDGYEVARCLRRDEATRDAYLVALTGYGQEEARRRSLEAGFDVHLTKPLRLADLEEILSRAVAVGARPGPGP